MNHQNGTKFITTVQSNVLILKIIILFGNSKRKVSKQSSVQANLAVTLGNFVLPHPLRLGAKRNNKAKNKKKCQKTWKKSGDSRLSTTCR